MPHRVYPASFRHQRLASLPPRQSEVCRRRLGGNRRTRICVFIQDYHFALLPRMLKDARPDLVVIQFWHIPWPNREVFRVCPWGEQVLDGLLGNDLLGFHNRYHCQNFLEPVAASVEARVDYDQSAITRGSHLTTVRPFPISLDIDAMSQQAMS